MEFLKTLEAQIVVLDGGTGTMVQSLGLSDDDFGGEEYKMLSDLLVFSRPESQREIHLAYLRAGANAVETNTFGASALRMAEYDFSRLDTSSWPENPFGVELPKLSHPEVAYYVSKQAAILAKEALDIHRKDEDYDGRPLFVMGSVGPSNWVLSKTRADLRVGTFEQIVENFENQVKGLLEGGIDVVLIETQQDILEVKAAVFGARRAMEAVGRQVPIMAQVTVDEHARMQIFNTDIHAALVTVKGIGVDVFGINCSIGPDLMEKAVESMARHSPLPISVIPNAGLPVSIDGETVFRLEPEPFTELLVGLVERYGIAVTGGCCGTRPDHIRSLSDAMRGRKPAVREPQPGLWVSGPQNAVLLDSSQTLVKIGERLNVRGSRKVRKAVETEGKPLDLDALEEVVTEQVRDLGLDLIDVCMDSNLVDTDQTMKTVVHELTDDFPAAMVLDSFSVETLGEAIKVYPGRPIVNSISLETYAEGLDKIDAVMEATREHDPLYIALCTGPEGPGATADEKVDLATRILEKAERDHGVPHENILVDVNVFPIGAESTEGMNFARETLEAVRRIKERFPEAHTTLGVGNLTTGLGKKPYMRKVLLSVFMEEARQAGLDAAILNPEHYVFPEDLDPADYDLGRRVILERDMDAFAELEDIATRKRGKKVTRRSSYEDLPLEEAICAKIKDGHKDRGAGTVTIEGHEFEYKDRIVEQVAQVIGKHEPLRFVNDYLMKAMKELGDAFGRGDASLPHLLKSADVMKHAMGFLEHYMQVKAGRDLHDEIDYKGTIVLGTVFQDVHSIGKDLAKTLFENYGYRVIDTGVQTPLQEYVDLAKEHGADAIGASALLVQTSNHMITLSKMMREQGLDDVHLLIGGAPVNLRHAGYVAMAGEEDPEGMRRNVFYCASAMDGVNVMNALMAEGADVEGVLAENRERLEKNFARAEKRAQETAQRLAEVPRREISFEEHRLAERPWAGPERIDVAPTDLREEIDRKTLFGLNWRMGGEKSWEKRGTSREQLEELLGEWLEKGGEKGWLAPRGVFAIFPAKADGDELVVYDPERHDRELGRFHFTVVLGRAKEDKFSPAQFFRPLDAEEPDAVGIQLTSAGPEVDEALEELKASGDSEGALLLQGLADRIAEDLADRVHGVLRERAGVAATCGERFSPGYASIVDPRNNDLILELLRGGELGISATDAGQFHPTSTTAAIVSFHPDASYQ